MWQAKVIKAEDVVFEDRVGQHPVKTRFARIVRQPLSGGLGLRGDQKVELVWCVR